MKLNRVSDTDFENRVNESLAFIKKKTKFFEPHIGIILGTGLGGLVKDVDINYILEYNDIPNFPVSTVESHHGKLIFGEIHPHRLIIMQGRFHYYEGHSMYDITFPIHLMQKLGVKKLLVSNVSGAVNPLYGKGDLMIIRDHINFLFHTPFTHRSRFKLRSQNRMVYDKRLIKLAEKTASKNKIKLRKGVYCTFQGPNLETRNEYRFARKIGADVVGMSTVPEALVSRENNFKVLGFSIITDVGSPDNLKPVVLKE
ncbi:MAG: purine-nucleoside phosphorylase, partial [Ignavibacteria bacterium]